MRPVSIRVCSCCLPGTSRIPTRGFNYPDSNDTDGVHDPAQAWNALTVGAFTDRVRITEPDAADYAPVAPRGALSPFSTTSLTWEKHWPLKPDVVLEGGNAAKDLLWAVTTDSLSLLTTHHRPAERIFTTTCATSAAMALAARLAARIMVVYPESWPETVRALIVHAAEWTDAMKRASLPANGSPTKADYQRLLQRCGFGVPALDRALWTVENSLTMVVEERLHPFEREGARQPRLRDMHLHNLPWPRESLGGAGRDGSGDARHALLFHRAEPVAARRPFTIPVRVSRSPFRRQATARIDRRVSAAGQRGRKGRGGGDSSPTRHRSRLADWQAGSPQGFAARGHLARRRGRTRESRMPRRLPGGRLVEDPSGPRTIRPDRAVRAGGQHQGAGGRRGSADGSRQPDWRSGGDRGLMQFGIADTFTASLAKLTGEEQKAVKTTAFDLQMNPGASGPEAASGRPGQGQELLVCPRQPRYPAHRPSDRDELPAVLRRSSRCGVPVGGTTAHRAASEDRGRAARGDPRDGPGDPGATLRRSRHVGCRTRFGCAFRFVRAADIRREVG